MTKFKTPFKLKNQNKNPELIWIALLAGVLGNFSAQPATAEGSRELVIGGGARPASEWRPNDVLGGVPRTTRLQVFAQNGEVINLGSSAIGVSRNGNFGNAIIRDSGGAIVRDCRVDQAGNGFISSNTQESAGPNTVAAGGYTPCTFNVTSTGIYRVEFHGPDGPNPPAGAGQINLLRPIVGNTATFPNNFNDQQGSRVALWDVTVTSGTTARPGRLFTNYLSLITGGNGAQALVNSNIYVVTRDGYQYNVQTNNLDPNGFIFFSNNRGFVNSNNNQALYRSINLDGPDTNLVLPPGLTFQRPDQPDTTTDTTNKIFFNQPDPLALTALGITTNPQIPQPATGFQFRGQEGTVGQAGTNPLQGNFEFNNPNSVPVSYKIVIDTNRNGSYNDPEDRVLIGTALNGANQITWDGRDELGNPVPAGNFSYGATISLNAGEVHFPLLDPENAGGLIITRQQPNIAPPNPSLVYYDNRGVRDITQGGPPNPLFNLTGLPSSSGNVNRFGDGSGTGFGDKKGIDTWAFLPSTEVINQNIVTIKQADLVIEKTLDPQNPTPASGGPVNYILRVRNLGPSPLNTVGNSADIDARVQDTIDPQISNVTWTCAPAAGAPAGSICRTANGTGNAIDTRVNLPVNGEVEFRITGTLAANIAPGTTINNTATVFRPKDVTDPNYFADQIGTDNNRRSIGFTVAQSTADVAIAKTQTSQNPATPGQNITYNLVVTATGSTDSTNVQVGDNIPAGFNFVSNSGDCTTAFPCNLGTIPTGQTRTITTTLAVPANYNGPTSVTNTATVNSGNDSNPNNNTANAQTNLTIPQTADVAIAKTQTSQNPATPGQNITYNLVVTATGSTESTNVQVGDNIPAGFNFVSNSGDCTTAFPCNLGTIPTGQTRTITTTLAVPANYNGPTSVTNTATVNSGNDSNPNNNTANAQTNIQQNADVVTTKTGPATVTPGGSITYTISTTNNGPNPAINTIVRDTIPPETTFSSASDGGTFANGVVTFPAIPSLASGVTVTRTVTVIAPTTGGPLVNRASNTSDTPDPNPTNNDGSQPPAQVTTTLTPLSADLITVKNGPATVAPGGSITYSINTTNNGPSAATNVIIRDTIPPETTFSSASDGGTFANGVVTFPPISSLPSGVTVTRFVTVTAPTSGGPLVNSASNTSDTPDPNPTNNDGSQPPARVTTTLTSVADVITTKTGPATVAPGGSITYTITTTNNGPNAATNVVIRDNIPPETTFSSASDGGTFANGVVTFPVIPSLASGASVTRTVTVTAPASGGPLVNRASNTSDTPDPTPNNNDGSQPPAQVTTTLTQPSADVITTKTGPTTIAPGGTIAYTITTTNNGPSPATNVAIRDTIPPETTFSSASDGGTFANGVVTFPPIANLAPNTSVTRTVTVTAPASGGPLVNRAANTSDTPDPNPTNNDGSQPPAQVVTTLTTTNNAADVITTKTGPSTVAPGGTISYTITTVNNGPSPATNVVIRDTLPAGVTFSSASDGGTFADGVVTFPAIPSLASGASVTRTITVTAPSSGGPLVNRASNTSDTPDPNPVNNDGSQPPAQVVTTLSTPTTSADVITTKTGPSTIAPGATITYTITTRNNGPDQATNVIIRDRIPPETTFGSASDGGTFADGVVTFPIIPTLASGASITRTVTVTAPTSGGPLVNRASNTSDTPDPTPANNDGSQPPAQVVTTLSTPTTSADVITTKTGPSTIAPGATITYTITTRNNGPDQATNVIIRDGIPPETTFSSASDGGTFANGVVTFPAIPSLASGASVTRTVTVIAPASGGPLVNRASNTSDTPDPTPANNDGSQPPAQVVTTLTPPAPPTPTDVVTTVTSPTQVDPGSTITYTITTQNNGSTPASNVIIRNTLPPGVTFNNASDGGILVDGVVVFPAIPTLAPGQSITRTITVTAPTTSSGPLVNQVSSTSDTPDPTPSNNDGSQPSSQVTTTVTPQTTNVQVTQAGPTTPVPAGSNVTLTTGVTNNGTIPATNVILTNPLPPNVTFVSATPSQGTCTFANGSVTCNLGTINPNQTVNVAIVVIPTQPGNISNPISVSGTNIASSSSNNITTPIQVVPPQTDLEVTQTGPTEPQPIGENTTFNTVVTNKGPVTGTAVTLTNPLPPNTTFVSATPTQGTCQLTNNNVVCNLGDLNPGQTVNIPTVVTPVAPGTITNQVSIASPNDSNPANNQASAIAQIIAREPRVRLVKRITSVIRSGSVFLFNNLVDDPTDENDNAPGWNQFRPLGVVSVPVSEPVRSGDTVEYTIYFLSDGTTPADNVRICDAIPDNTTFIPDGFGSGRGMQLNLAGVVSALTNDQDGDVGRFFSVLAPLPTGNPCVNPNNPNGTVLFNIDRIPSTAGNNFGFVRFRVRVE